MLNMITWLWKSPPGYRSTFTTAHVNTLKRMIARHYPAPHRFCCVTDVTKGLDPDVAVIPAWNDFATLPSPSGGRNPSCYRRLRAFDPAIGAVFGPRFASFDLDMVITGDLRPLLDRAEDFVIFADTNPKTFYNGSLLLMTAGARPQVWTSFDPKRSPALAKAAGHHGSDQGWISYCLGPKEAKYTPADGVYSFLKHLQPTGGKLPKDAKVVVFHGHVDPWQVQAQTQYPWIRAHWC